MYSILYVVQLVGVITGLITIIIVATQKASENQKILLLCVICGFISMLAYYMEISASEFREMLLAIKIGYLGKCYCMLGIFYFVSSYCQVKIPKWLIGILFAFNTFILSLVFTCEKHELYYKNMRLTDVGLFTHIKFDRGPFYIIFMVITLVFMIVAGFILISKLLKSKGEARSRLVFLGLIGLSPTLMLIIYLSGITKAFDLVPMGMLLACVMLAISVIRYGLFDTIRLAKENIIENISEGLVVVDENYNFLYANPAAYELMPNLASSEAFMVNNVIDKLFAEDECVCKKNNKTYQIRKSTLNEERIHKGYMAWIFDMTFVNTYTSEMIKLKEEAEKASECKSIFLESMSDRIKEPMGSIIESAKMINRNNVDENTTKCISSIEESAHVLMDVANDISYISKIEGGKIEIVKVEYDQAHFFEGITREMMSLTQKNNLKFIFNFDRLLPSRLYGDEKKVRESIINLFEYSLHKTHDGYMKFSVEMVSIHDNKARIKYVIQDTGIGMTQEEQEKLFDKYQFLKFLNDENSELGVVISRGFVDLMNGEIEIYSTYGEGTTFIIILEEDIVDEQKIGDIGP